MRGRVMRSTGSWYDIRTEEGETLKCRIKGKLRLKGIKSTNPLAVGDWVNYQYEDTDNTHGLITGIEDRTNYIIRKSVNLSKRTHILASNIDQAVLIVTLAFPKTFTRFIDRFLITAEAYSIPAVLVFNKLDLYDDAMRDEMEFLIAVYESAGYKCLQTSTPQKLGLDAFVDVLKDKTSLLSGHSGVGKSSLINAVEPQLDLKTSRLSEAHLQGQHTTTFAEMFNLSFGGEVIDSPGIKGFGLVDMDKHEIGDYFPEIFELKKECRFHNCLHLEEPGCAVKEAYENARLAYTRYESYCDFVLEAEDPYRQDDYA